MIQYTTGDLLLAPTQALVNTVNCEGYMGKGIAYQFKLKYPKNNIDYVAACKNGTLTVGKLTHFFEKDKLIINFPTKGEWRIKSKIEYIENGLDALIKLIYQLEIKSIAIPPLGSGNGGLVWSDVKKIIENKLAVLDKNIDILIYEPSKNYVSEPALEPKLSLSAYVLMLIKENLNKFNSTRLQKAAYFTNIFYGEKYFNFKPYRYGPYDSNIDRISKKIIEFQSFHSIENQDIGKKIIYNRIISKNIETKLYDLEPALKKSCQFINSISSDKDVECCATTAFILEGTIALSEEDIITNFKGWSADKASRFSECDIRKGILALHEEGIIRKNLIGYTLP